MGVLQLVQVVGEVGQALLEPLSLLGVEDDLVGLGRAIQGVTRHDLPVVEDALGECLPSSVGAEVSSETYLKEKAQNQHDFSKLNR